MALMTGKHNPSLPLYPCSVPRRIGERELHLKLHEITNYGKFTIPIPSPGQKSTWADYIKNVYKRLLLEFKAP